MGYDPTTNTMQRLDKSAVQEFTRKRPEFLFTEGEEITIKGVVFDIHEIGEKRLILKPVRALSPDWRRR